MSIITAKPSLTLLERGVKLSEAESFSSSNRLLRAHNSFISLHRQHTGHPHTLLLVSHPQLENHQIAQLVHCQNKKSRMVQFKRNSTSKGSGLSIYSLVSEKNSTAPSCTASGNRTSKKLLYKCSLQPVWKREITHWPFWAFPLSCHLCNKPLNNQMHRDFQVLINSLPLHFHKRTCDNIDSRLPNPVLESFPHSQPCASPSQRTQTNSTRSRCKWTPSCYHLLESFSPASQDAMKHMIEPTWLITWTLLLPQGPPNNLYPKLPLHRSVPHPRHHWS